MGISEKAGEIFITVVKNSSFDLDDIYSGAKNESLSSWKTRQNAMVTGSGAAAVSIPGLHLVGMAADIAFVLNRMGTASYGVGAIIGYDNDYGNIMEEDDFELILAYWANDREIIEAMKGKVAADLSAKIAAKFSTKLLGKEAAKVLTQTMLSSVAQLAAKKATGKMLSKPAVKFASKFAAKGLGGFVPILGAAVGGGINLWLLNGIQDAAEEFYVDKVNLAKQIALYA